MWLLEPTGHVDVPREAGKSLFSQEPDIFHLAHRGPMAIHEATKRKTP
jgi:hypothetical protein